MATVRAAILADLAATIGAIAALAAAGGCQRFKQDGIDLADPPLGVVLWDSDDVISEAVGVYDRHLLARVAILFQTVAGTTTDEQNDVWAARVEAAVMADRSLGGNAKDTTLITSGPHGVTAGMPSAGITSEFRILYQTANLGG